MSTPRISRAESLPGATGEQLILASASPRRSALLQQIGVPCTVHPADIDETRLADELPTAYVERLAREKARVVAALYPESIVLAADTTVALGSSILNKPADVEEARRMLQELSGRSHFVHTGIAVQGPSRAAVHVETTAVTFTEIAEGELSHYLRTGDSLDKAGAYGIQGYAARWVSHISGDFFNVMGLPLAATVWLLRQAGAVYV